jgi:RNA polymerase primary sigma factor
MLGVARRPDPSNDDALRAYLRAIARTPRLSAEEEQALARRIQDSDGTDDEALRRLVEGNLRFVVHYAKRYRGFGVPFLDLIHEGNLGLIEAAKRFKPERVKFITYAVWWIRQSILHALSSQSRVFSLPQKVSAAALKFRREVANLTEALDRAPSVEEIAAKLGLSEPEIDALAQIGASDVSLSDVVAGDAADGVQVGERIEQMSVPPAEEAVIRRRLSEQLASALSELDAKEREVVRMRFGLTREGEPRTLQEIGDTLQLSRERIRQIETRAKEKLRQSKRAVGLRSYLN